MALRQMKVEWKQIRTYATEAGLAKYLEECRKLYPDYDDRFIVVRTPEGRWTAIVSLDLSQGGYIGRYDLLKM
jgi:hypothetical protein